MRLTNRTMRIAAGCIVALGAQVASAQDWSQWRGANRDGKTSFTAPQTWPKELVKKWKLTVGAGDATPALVGDRVYVFAKQGNDEVLQCLNAADGKPIWSDKYANSVTVGGPASGHKGPRSCPAVVDGMVLTLDEGATMSCLDAATGKLVWRKDFAKDLGSAWPNFNTSTSPIIVDGLAVAHLGGRGKGTVLALDMKTGETKWKWEGDAPAYASPALMTVDGTKMIVEETEKSVIALSASDGKLLWQVAYGTGSRGGMRGGPGGPGGGGDRGPGGTPGGFRGRDGGRPGGDRGPGGEGQPNDRGPRPEGAPQSGRPDALQADAPPGDGPGRPEGRGDGGGRPSGDRGRGGPGGAPGGRGGGMGGMTMSYNAASPVVDGNVVIVSAPGAGTKAFEITKAGDAFAAKELWTNSETTTQFNTPIIRDGRLYGISAKGNLFCLDTKTGKTLWTDTKSIGERGFGTLVDAGSVLVAMTPNSELTVFEPSDKQYTEVARLKVSGAQTYAYPVLAGNRVIIKDQDAVTVYAIQ